MSKPVLNKIHCKPVLRCIAMYNIVSLYYFLLLGVSEPVLNKIYVCEPVLNKNIVIWICCTISEVFMVWLCFGHMIHTTFVSKIRYYCDKCNFPGNFLES